MIAPDQAVGANIGPATRGWPLGPRASWEAYLSTGLGLLGAGYLAVLLGAPGLPGPALRHKKGVCIYRRSYV